MADNAAQQRVVNKPAKLAGDVRRQVLRLVVTISNSLDFADEIMHLLVRSIVKQAVVRIPAGIQAGKLKQREDGLSSRLIAHQQLHHGSEVAFEDGSEHLRIATDAQQRDQEIVNVIIALLEGIPCHEVERDGIVAVDKVDHDNIAGAIGRHARQKSVGQFAMGVNQAQPVSLAKILQHPGEHLG